MTFVRNWISGFGIVDSSKVVLHIGAEERVVQQRDFFCIPANVTHSDTCIGNEPFVIRHFLACARGLYWRTRTSARVRKEKRMNGYCKYQWYITGYILFAYSAQIQRLCAKKDWEKRSIQKYRDKALGRHFTTHPPLKKPLTTMYQAFSPK